MAKIVIDAGHGYYTSGKRCLKKLDPKQTREWYLNDRIADYVGQFLKSAGHSIYRVDDTDGTTDISLSKRASRANKWGADFYISIHHNAGIGGGSGGGTEVYVYTKASSKSKKAQDAIYKKAIKYGKLKGNRADGTRSANFAVLRQTKMAACLIECGYMDSKTDIKYILDAAWAKNIAKGIAEGICDVYGGSISMNSTAASTTKNSSKTFKVKVTTSSLNIRAGAGTRYKKVGGIKDKGVYTIVATNGKWGKLKSGAGWIHLGYTKSA